MIKIFFAFEKVIILLLKRYSNLDLTKLKIYYNFLSYSFELQAVT